MISVVSWPAPPPHRNPPSSVTDQTTASLIPFTDRVDDVQGGVQIGFRG